MLKNVAFFIVSLNLAHAAAAIFVSPKELLAMIMEGPALHMEAFLLVMGFTAILTFNFTWFREQFCVVLCPYGRLQSVLHDKDSVTRQLRRGARRAARQAGEAARRRRRADAGRLHRLPQCVTVCPTGIDIRNGLQMECLACTSASTPVTR